MNPITRAEIYLVVFLVIGLGITGAYFYAKHEGVMEERARWEVKQAAATKADLDSLTQAVGMSNQIALDTAEKIGKGKARSVIDRGVIEREIRTDVRYVNDCLPDAGRLRWNDISAGRPLLPDSSAGAKPDGRVPEGNGAASAGWKSRNPLAQPSGGAGGLRRVPNKP